MSKYVYGIDLGTTYSCIAYQDENGRPTVCKNLDGLSTTPSVVQFQENGEPTIGLEAKQTSIMYPEQTVDFVKRKMGKEKVAFTTKDGQEISPSGVSQWILRDLAKSAADATADTVENVVITCPAYFGESEIEATRQAGILAGLNVLDILKEPTAAAIHYGVRNIDAEQNILVYDLGGGTFDITVMRINKGEISEITIEGDHYLGGKNWDDVIAEHLRDAFREQTGFQDDFDEESTQDFQIAAESMKITLTKKAEVSRSFSVTGMSAKLTLTREIFDSLTAGLLQQTIELTNTALATAKEKGVGKIDKVLLVGGSTKMPQVSEKLVSVYGDTLGDIKSFDPDEAVACGAAIWASTYIGTESDVQPNGSEAVPDGARVRMLAPVAGGSVSGNQNGRQLSIKTVTSNSFGIKCYVAEGKESIANIIFKDDELPVNKTEMFSTLEANQHSVALRIYQSHYKEQEYDIDEDFFVAEAILELPSNTPAKSQIAVTMTCGKDGLLFIKGVHTESGRSCETQLDVKGALSEEEMENEKKIISDMLVRG